MVLEPIWLCKRHVTVLLVAGPVFECSAGRRSGERNKKVEIEETSVKLKEVAQQLEHLDKVELTGSLNQLFQEYTHK